MASFISALSLLILVLVNGYFAIPVFDESARSSFHDDLTTEHAVNLRYVPDDEATGLPMEPKRPTGEYMGLKMTPSSDGLSENAARVLGVFHPSFDFDQSKFTTEKPSIEPRAFKDISFGTGETFTYGTEHKRPTGEYMGLEMTTSGDGSAEKGARVSHVFHPSFDFDQSKFTTEKPSIKPREFKDLPFDTAETFTHGTEHERRGVKSEDDDENETETDADEESTDKSESEHDKRDVTVESSTSFIPSFTSTSSTVPPQLFTSESSTKKYIGLLKDHEEPSESQETEKPIKKQPIKPEDKSEEVPKLKPLGKPAFSSTEDSNESRIPTLVNDQDALKQVSTPGNGVMVLDENNDLVVTNLPNKFSKTNKENEQPRKPLNQGEKSSQSEEEKSNHWNGSSFGWILSSPTYLPTSWKTIN